MKHDGHALNTPVAAEEHPLIEEFKRCKSNHAHLTNSLNHVLRFAQRPGTSGVVILTGPTGSGKTHLARQLYLDLRGRFSPEENTGQPFASVIGIRAVPPRATAFDWQDFFIRLLEQLRDVLVERKLLVPIQYSLLGEFPVSCPAESMKVTALRRSVEKALRVRKTRVLIIDEAHHILMCKDPDLQRFVFEQLKSLTDETGTILVLVGTYDLLDIRDHSGQLMRRSEIVHLKRYDYNDKSERNSFLDALKEFNAQMPIRLRLDNKANTASAVDTCYLKTGGCIGILRDLLLECLRQAIETGKDEIEVSMIDSCAKSNMAVRTILQEAIEGEARLKDIDDSEIRRMLLDPSDESLAASDDRPVKNKGREKPGKRNPSRDAVGAN